MLKRFLLDDGGAVTVDWVVLTAGLVGLSLAVMSVVSSGVENLSRDVAAHLESIQIRTSFAEWDEFRTAQIAGAAEEVAEDGEP
jgi:hypothetical protein